jgi:hypothetical protein
MAPLRSVQRRNLPKLLTTCFHRPPLANLDRCGNAFPGDDADYAEFAKQIPGSPLS